MRKIRRIYEAGPGALRGPLFFHISGRKSHFKHGAAVVSHTYGAVIRLGDGLRDGKADPVSAARTLIEALEHMRQIPVGNARPVVLDRDEDLLFQLHLLGQNPGNGPDARSLRKEDKHSDLSKRSAD